MPQLKRSSQRGRNCMSQRCSVRLEWCLISLLFIKQNRHLRCLLGLWEIGQEWVIFHIVHMIQVDREDFNNNITPDHRCLWLINHFMKTKICNQKIKDKSKITTVVQVVRKKTMTLTKTSLRTMLQPRHHPTWWQGKALKKRKINKRNRTQKMEKVRFTIKREMERYRMQILKRRRARILRTNSKKIKTCFKLFLTILGSLYPPIMMTTIWVSTTTRNSKTEL